MADTELQQLSKTDRNPIQESRYKELLAQQGSGSYSGGSIGPQSSFEDTLKRTIELSQQANKPAVDSLQASIPEQSAKFAQQRTQLEAEKQPLKDRYQSLLAQIKGNQKVSEDRQFVTTNNELGKRGISGDSTLAQQEITNALNPITQQYTGLYTDTGLAQESDLRSLVNQIANSSTTETEANRLVQNAIAQLQAGGAQSGINLGSNLFQFNTAQNTQQELARQQAAFQSQQLTAQQQQNAIDNAIKQQQLANQTKETNYAVNKPYYQPTTGGGSDISALQAIFGGKVAGQSTNSGPRYTLIP